jgi:hypothetical protein
VLLALTLLPLLVTPPPVSVELFLVTLRLAGAAREPLLRDEGIESGKDAIFPPEEEEESEVALNVSAGVSVMVFMLVGFTLFFTFMPCPWLALPFDTESSFPFLFVFTLRYEAPAQFLLSTFFSFEVFGLDETVWCSSRSKAS